jgi:hypothetical protein
MLEKIKGIPFRLVLLLHYDKFFELVIGIFAYVETEK